MTEQNQPQDSNNNRRAFAFLAIVVFLLTMLLAQFGANIIDAMVLNGVGAGLRWIFIFVGFLFYYPMQKIIQGDGTVTFQQARAMMKDEFSQRYTREQRMAMTPEEKRESRKIYIEFFKFSLGILAVGFMLELVIGLALINLMN